MGLGTDCTLGVPGILNTIPVLGEVPVEVFEFPSFLRTLFTSSRESLL